ncbi:MAG: Rne/Rng family ribonuclease [Chromatiales bacterium]
MKRMLVNATQQEELRVAIVDGQRLYDLDIEAPGREQKKANIYKGKITRLEPSLEAAFVEFGSERHGFLPLKEISPEYFVNRPESGGKVNIRDVLKEGQDIVIQVEKEERGTKGAALTTFISLAGRFLVLMPNNPRAGGVSRRITGPDRDLVRDSLAALELPEGMGVIVRTAGVGRSPEELQWDLEYLLKVWEAVKVAAVQGPSPSLIYQESNAIIRALRDYLSADVGEILIDDESVYNQAREFVERVMPHNERKIKRYAEEVPLFTRYQIESQIQSAFSHSVSLPSGGSIVIDHTEALVSIDINSARATKGDDIEATAFNTNLEAAEEIARQLRIRDIGGLIVIDFIDMGPQRNQREVENRLRESVRMDRARVQIAMVVAQLPVEVATYLLNEKREWVNNIEVASSVSLRLVANPQLETPNYSIRRVRDDEAELPEFSAVSYQLPTESEEDEDESGMPAPKPVAEKPAVGNLVPDRPVPVPPPEPETPSESGFSAWLRKMWQSLTGSGSAKPAPEKKKPATRSRRKKSGTKGDARSAGRSNSQRASRSDSRRKKPARKTAAGTEGKKGAVQTPDQKSDTGGKKNGSGESQPTRSRRSRRGKRGGGKQRAEAASAQSPSATGEQSGDQQTTAADGNDSQKQPERRSGARRSRRSRGGRRKSPDQARATQESPATAAEAGTEAVTEKTEVRPASNGDKTTSPKAAVRTEQKSDDAKPRAAAQKDTPARSEQDTAQPAADTAAGPDKTATAPGAIAKEPKADVPARAAVAEPAGNSAEPKQKPRPATQARPPAATREKPSSAETKAPKSPSSSAAGAQGDRGKPETATQPQGKSTPDKPARKPQANAPASEPVATRVETKVRTETTNVPIPPTPAAVPKPPASAPPAPPAKPAPPPQASASVERRDAPGALQEQKPLPIPATEAQGKDKNAAAGEPGGKS